MSIYSRCTKLAPGIALLITASAITALSDQPVEKSHRSASGSTVILLLDGYIQTRFEQDNDKFGLSRLAPPVNGHNTIGYQLNAADSGEKELIHSINSSGYEYLVEFVHCTHVPGWRVQHDENQNNAVSVRGMTLVAAKSKDSLFDAHSTSEARRTFRKNHEEPIEKQAAVMIAKVAAGKTVDTRVGSWQVAFRSVRASKSSCLGCHIGAKAGDMLGMVAYAVRRIPDAADQVDTSTRVESKSTVVSPTR